MSTSSIATLVAGICSFIPYILFIPLSVYGNIKLYRCRKELFVQKRNVLIALGLNCSLIFQMIASLFAHLSLLYLNRTSTNLAMCVFFSAYWVLLYFLNCKNWMIYFNEKWTKYALDLEWQQIINPNFLSTKNKRNWFIRNKHKYGNIRYIFKLFGILHFLGLTLLITAQSILISSNGHPNAITFSIVMITVTIVPFITFYVFLVFKTPRFNDIFNIHWESQMHARLIVIMGIGFIAWSMSYTIDFNNKNTYSISAMLCFPFVCLILFIMSMISTLLIIKKTETHSLKRMPYLHSRVSNSPRLKNQRQQSVMSQSKSTKTSVTNLDKRFYTLDLILSNKDSFHLFMVHLSKEFSMECLLAYIELTQFQQYILKQNTENGKIKRETVEKLKLIQFPESIPQSGIVMNGIKISKFNNLKNNAMEYKLKLNKLFDKYIKVGSAYEINISYQQRGAWMAMMSGTSNLWSFMHVNVDLNELLLLIEQCKVTMNKLLDHSLHRFKTYAKFAEVQQIEFKNIGLGVASMKAKIEQSVTDTKQSRLSAVFHRLPTMSKRTSVSRSDVSIIEEMEESKDTQIIVENGGNNNRKTVRFLDIKSMESDAETENETENEKDTVIGIQLMPTDSTAL